MSKWPEDYEKYVLEDVKVFPIKNKPVKAGIIERLFVSELPPKQLHCNPADEFSIPEVGPNFEIVSDYTSKMGYNSSVGLPLINEPIIIEKMQPEDFMIVNGHHRWLASMRIGVPKIQVNIVNLTHSEDILRALSKTNNTLSVAFDLDEVLLVGENGFTPEEPKKFFGRRQIKERLRKGAAEVLNAFRENGFDVWVYTSGYLSEKYLNAMFKLYGVEVTGIINGTGRKMDASAKETKERLEGKYTGRLHVDNESAMFVKTGSMDFDSFEFTKGADGWEQDVLDVLNKIKG